MKLLFTISRLWVFLALGNVIAKSDTLVYLFDGGNSMDNLVHSEAWHVNNILHTGGGGQKLVNKVGNVKLPAVSSSYNGEVNRNYWMHFNVSRNSPVPSIDHDNLSFTLTASENNYLELETLSFDWGVIKGNNTDADECGYQLFLNNGGGWKKASEFGVVYDNGFDGFNEHDGKGFIPFERVTIDLTALYEAKYYEMGFMISFYDLDGTGHHDILLSNMTINGEVSPLIPPYNPTIPETTCSILSLLGCCVVLVKRRR